MFKFIISLNELNKKQYLIRILLLGILLFHFLNNFLWLRISNNIIQEGCDGMGHMIEAIRFQLAVKEIFHSHSLFLEKIAQVFSIFRTWPTQNWPPFIYFLSSLIEPNYFSFFHVRLYVNFIFYSLLILSTYFLGKKCFNWKIGLIAAFLVSFYPAIYAFSRQFGTDFPITSLTALCICLLVYSENFSKRTYCLLFGLSLGVATLVKLQIVFFLLAPLLYSIFKMLSKESKEKSKAFLNFFLSLSFAYLLFSLYWGIKLKSMFANFYEHAFSLYPFYKGKIVPTLGEATPIFSLKNITFYLKGLLYHSSLYLFALFAFAFIIFFLNKNNKWRGFFFSSFAVPYFILTFISVKWVRYELPLLIFMAIISAWLVDNLKFRFFKIIILGMIIFYSTGIYFLSSWRIDKNYYPRFCQSPYSCPPDSNDFIEVLKKKGIISCIENRLGKNDIIRIRHIGGNSLCIVGHLYLFFQSYILANKIDINRAVDFSSIDNVDYIIAQLYRDNTDYIDSENGKLLYKKELFKKFRLLSEIKGIIFLEKI